MPDSPTIIPTSLMRDHDLALKIASLESGGANVGPPLINVTQSPYNADPTGVADATAAFNAAILALPVTGGTVYVPPGDYKIAGTIVMGDGTTTSSSTRTGIVLTGAVNQGVYPNQTILNPAGYYYGSTRLFSTAATAMIQVAGPLQGWGIHNLYLDGMSVGAVGLEEIACQGGDCDNVTIVDFVFFGQRCSALVPFSVPVGPHNQTGGPLTVGANHSRNIYRNFCYRVPNLNAATAIRVRGNAIEASSDSWGDLWEHLTVKFSGPPSGTNIVTGIYLQACDNENFFDVFFETPGATTGTARFRCIVFDYATERTNMPADCRFDVVDFQHNYQTTGLNPVINVGAPVGQAFPNRITRITSCNVQPPNPNLANLIWENVIPRQVVAVGGGSDVTLNQWQNQCNILEFTGVKTANINVIVENADGRQYTIFNNTTGAFTLTVKGATGTGVVIANGKRAIVYGDGANVQRASADV